MHSGHVVGAGFHLLTCGCFLGQCELMARCTCHPPYAFVSPQWTGHVGPVKEPPLRPATSSEARVWSLSNFSEHRVQAQVVC